MDKFLKESKIAQCTQEKIDNLNIPKTKKESKPTLIEDLVSHVRNLEVTTPSQ